MSADPVNIQDRFYEPDMPMSGPEKEREAEGWAIFKDRATGRVLIVGANSRAGALWVLRALNAADRTEDRLSEDAA